MYKLTFIYSKAEPEDFRHIEKVEYMDAIGQNIIVSGDEIFTHNFPLYCNMHLFSANKNYIISSQGLIRIEVTKE